MKASDTVHEKKIGIAERILRSRTMRGIVRIHAGGSLVRTWSGDIQIPRGTTLHLFDYLLYRRSGREKPLKEWLKERKLLSP
jgi:hypothetical protein